MLIIFPHKANNFIVYIPKFDKFALDKTDRVYV